MVVVRQHVNYVVQILARLALLRLVRLLEDLLLLARLLQGQGQRRRDLRDVEEEGVRQDLLRSQPLVRVPADHLLDQVQRLDRRVRDQLGERESLKLRQGQAHGRDEAPALGPLLLSECPWLRQEITPG